MYALEGTLRLLRLAFRLDRIKLLIWIVAIVGLITLTLSELKNAYDTPEKQAVYAATAAPSMVTRLMAGAITGPSIGEITVIESFALVALLVALMNIFAITRHTRTEEETGRGELVGSMLVGRQAGLSAALLQALIVNSIVGFLLFAVFIQNSYDTAGSLAFVAGIAGVGIVFAAVSAITAQLFESARTANSLAGLVFGICFVLRGVGDAFGTVNADGVSVTTSWLSWLSPVGWATNILPFHGERWWVLGFFGILTMVLIGVAYVLLARRDVGSSIFATKPGRAQAPPGLLREFGLLWRLNRVAFFAWLLACMALGAILGSVANEFVDLVASNEEIQQMLAAYGQTDNPADLLFAATFTMSGIILTAYGLQLLLRMRTEETSGRLEVVLAAPVNRPRWMLRSVAFTIVTALLILFATGLTAGMVYGLIINDALVQSIKMSGAIMVYSPALLVVLGCGLLAFSVVPRLAAFISWSILAGCVLIVQLGSILGLPNWIVNLSPFSHTPSVPAGSITYAPLIIMTLVGLGLMVIAVFWFRQRDLITE